MACRAHRAGAIPLKWVAAIVVGLVIAAVALAGFLGAGAPKDEDCAGAAGASGAGVSANVSNLPGSVGAYSGKQLENAAIIINAGKKLGISKRGQTIAVMTAMGESTLNNIERGDAAGPDSRGLFQQRAEGWGTLEERMDPHTAATSFYKALQKVSGWESLEPSIAAHKAQINDDPYHYEEHWEPAKAVVNDLSDAKVSGGGAVKAQEASAGSGNAKSKPASAEKTKKKYGLGKVKDITAQAVGVLAPKFKIKTVGGHRESDPFPDHPSGLAADFMVPLNSAGQAQGDKLAKYLTEHHKEFGIKYLIWNQRSWYPDKGWKPMEDRGDPTQNHRDHVHVTFLSSADGNIDVPAEDSACANAGGGGSQAKASQVKGKWAVPSDGVKTSDFGPRDQPCAECSSHHQGTDISAGCNEPIYAAGSGKVVEAGPASGFGNWVKIDHGGGLVTIYGHMFDDGLLAKTGDTVKAGDHIAKEGENGVGTGCHLHFEVWQDGKKTDPEKFLNAQGIKVKSQ